jgi:N-acyl-D-amino-acid deacylase
VRKIGRLGQFASLMLVLGAVVRPLAAQSPRDDLHIVNGRIVDGSGAAWFYGDVAVAGGRIVAVVPRGALSARTARDTVNATGLVVAPGFIDIQGHSGWSLLYGDSRVVSKISQGVTTEILGEGSTPAPLNPRRISRNADAMTRRFAEPHGFANWLTALQTRGTAINVGSFVGGSTLRQYGMGLR